MPVDISATFDDKEVKKWLDDMSDNVEGFQKASSALKKQYSPVVFKDVLTHFSKEQGSAGPWPQWSSSYELQMEEKGKGGNNLLQDTGRLRNSLIPTSSDAPGTFSWVNPAKTSSGFPYAYAHDNSDAPRKRLPQRQFMWLSQQALDTIADITLDYVIKGKE